MTESDADQVNRNWHYGTEATLPYIMSLIHNRVPTSAIFTVDDHLVVYITSKGGGMINGFVEPEYRKRGFYEVVNYDLVNKLAASGPPCAWLFVSRQSLASLNAYKKLGAEHVEAEEYSVGWRSR